MLMALGVELPCQVFGHPWLMVGENKMSKSRGNVIYADHLVDLFGVDAVRYYLLHEMPFASDGTLTYELLCERVNSDLANILGNLVNRTIAMCHKYSGGVLSDHSVAGEFDEELKKLALDTPARMEAKMDELRVADCIDEVFALLRRANKYIDETMPWVLAKDEANHARLDTVLYNLLETIRFAATLLKPFLPETGDRIFKQLNIEPTDWESLSEFGFLKAGHKIGEGEILFSRIDVAKKLEEIAEYHKKLEEPAKPALPEFEKLPEIEYDDFAKVELTVGKVLVCEKVPKSSKLLRFELDMGDHQRQVLSGIAKWHKPEDLVGHNVVVVTNLGKRKMMGLESNGMILSSTCGEDDVRILLADNAIPGARLS
jgi:methionyl-tRNA synthetase